MKKPGAKKTAEKQILEHDKNEEKGKGKNKINLMKDETLWMKDIDNSNIKKGLEFTFCIGIFVEATPEYYGIIEMFNEASVVGTRWKIKVISKEYIRNVVHDNLRSNKYKPFKQLCTQIASYAGYDLDGKIPTKFLAYFIMYEIRRLKNVHNQMKLYEADIEEEKLKRLEKAFEQDSSEPTAEKIDELVKTNKIEDKNEVYGIRRPESELNTRLEERDLRFIDDHPIAGPQVYIAITTIYDPQLPTELIEVLGVPVHCVVKVGNDSTKVGEDDNTKEKNSNQNILQEMSNDYFMKKRNKRRPFHIDNLNEQKRTDINNFWSGLISKIQHPEKTSFYAKTTLAIYTPPLDKIDFKDKNWKQIFKKLLYDEMCHVLYNQYDLNVLYEKYMSSMEVTSLDPLGKCKLEKMSVYNRILQHIPNESINIPIIFDSIVAQISVLFGEKSGYEDILAKHKGKKIIQKQKSLLTNLKELNLLHDVLTIKDSLNDYKPRTILYGDTARLKSYHLGETAKFITQKTFRLLSMQYKNLFRNINKTITKDHRKQHMHMFRNAVGIRDRKKLAELLILLAIIDRNPFGPNFDPHNQMTENKGESTDIDTHYLIEAVLDSINETKINQNHTLIQNLNAIEEMHPEVMVQTLYKMTTTHNTVETKYIPLLDGYLFKFYNCPKNDYKTCVMQTPITLRDFVKYSLPEEKEWANLSLKQFQKINIPETFPSDLHLLKNGITDPIHPPVKVTPVLLIDSSSFSIPLGSVKKDEEQSSLSSNDDWEEDERCKEVQRVNKTVILQPKDIKHKQTVSKIYNVGPGKRLQFYSRTIEAMFRHGTKVRIHFQHQLYEKKIMNLELLTCGHRMYYSTSLNVNEDPISFQIHHRTGIILSFQQKESKKYTAKYTKFTKRGNYSDSEVDTDRNSRKETQKSIEMKEKRNTSIDENDSIKVEKAEELERCQIQSSPHPLINRLSTFTLSASWPSGYFMECNTLPKTETVYIKHRYLTKGPSCKLIENELYRLNLPNNNVIKFINNKTFEILFPTGEKIICQKYFWRKTKTQKRDVRTRSIYEKIKREIVPVLYKIFHTDGKVESFKDGKKESDGKINIRNSTDVLNDYKVSEMSNGTTIVQKSDASQVVEFNDGTRFTTLVQVSPEEVFCDWPLEEKLQWFQGYSDFMIMSDISEIEHPAQEKKIKDQPMKKGILENEGYVSITRTVFIEHPNFATTYNCSETKSTIIRFPMNTTIYLYSNGNYDIKFANGTNIGIKKDRFVIDKFMKNSLFQHTVIMPHALKFNDSPDPPLIQFLTSDIHGNELKIDTTNFLHYRYALSENNKFCLKHLTDNVNFFFLRRDLRGIEIFPHSRLANIKEINKTIKDSYVQEFWSTPFKDSIFLSPTETVSEEWIMPYSAPIASMSHNVPSTYGKSWVFPFDSKPRSYLITPKTLTMRVIKTFICENIYNKIVELIEDYKNMIDNQIHHPKCKCHKVRPWEHISFDNVQDIASILYKRGNIIIKTPDESFINYVKQFIVLHAARVAIKERKISKIIQKYQTQRTALLNKQIPPYFASCFGIAYLLTKEVREKTNRAIEEMEYTSILDGLLNKKINLVTENDINDITRLLKMLKSEIWNDQESVRKVLNTGKELQDSFGNMREVLKYHLGANQPNNLDTL
ncbi:uncharacterized protein [Halyomorpha halys]|uniref:uncharacterized protein isoform X2 n=1 Tax=Halyomorpha halys TaxID=286706 RepID=UPI0006D507C3|nr:uncharacterized protein LOC106685145 isoform X2 [Halyomorpha halys]